MEAPPIFYKYRSLSGENRGYVRDTVVNHNIYFAEPASLNDPFDCAPAFAPTFTPEGAYALAKRYLMRQNPRWDQSKIEREARGFVLETSSADMSVLAQDLRDSYDNLRSWLGIYCVSATRISALMWAHYADSHRGICVGFCSASDVFVSAQPVIYSKLRAVVDPINDSSEEKLAKSLLLKSSDWSYEEEWRVIDYEQGHGTRALGKMVMREVILGARISPTDKCRVTSWIKQLDHRPKLFQATLSPVRFSIEIHPCETVVG